LPQHETDIFFVDTDGVFKKMAPDGAVTSVAGAGALPDPTDEGDVLTVAEGEWAGEPPSGGSMPYALTQNGFILGGIAPAGADVVLLDPTPQPWQANHDYDAQGPDASTDGQTGWTSAGAFVVPTADDSTVFRAAAPLAGLTGESEPDFSDSGETGFTDDGDIVWDGPNAYLGPWTPDTAYTVDDFNVSATITANGFVWTPTNPAFPDPFPGGTTGSTPPDWSSVPNIGDVVTDNDLGWQNIGKAIPWSAGNRVAWDFDPTSPSGQGNEVYAVPATFVGKVWQLGYVVARQSKTGDTEPAWDTTPGNLTPDGDIFWVPSTDTPTAVLSGIAAETPGQIVTVVNPVAPDGSGALILIDEANAVTEYGAAAAPEAGAGLIQGGGDVNLPPSQAKEYVYANDQWQGLTLVS
jgi:hypothetical protein